jgi:serine/threonine protein kinase
MAINCPQCQHENPDDTTFCGKCATPLKGEVSISQTETIETSVERLTKGTLFAERYKITEELGQGGMGVVYKADDTKLKRTVALKTISPFILIKESYKVRFLREAQAAAALNHPNICTIYEIDEFRNSSFISMEYIEGQSLKDSIGARPLSFELALDIAIQVAEGLHHAHTKGVVHRDIKSANIMLRKDNSAKVMDFGLAKLTDSSFVTKEGTTVGTIAYMSPEQAKGESVDGRSDIWSLGVVLYEMISGQLPFRGEGDQTIIHAILRNEPQPLTSLRSGVPLELERILNRCLEKDPNYRFQSSIDLISELKRFKRDLEEGEVSKRVTHDLAHKQRKIPKWSIAAAVILISLVIAATTYFVFVKPYLLSIQPLSRLSLNPVTGGAGSAFYPNWSPDGTWIAYASDETGNLDIWKKPAEGGEAIQLTMSLNNENHPAWAPDGRKIAFSSDKEGSGIHLIPSEGGTPIEISSFGTHPSWSPDSETLAFTWCGNVYLVPYAGGEPRMVVRGTSAVPYTVWTPDGMRLILWNRTQRDIHVFSLENETSEPLGLVHTGQEVSGLTLSRDGDVLIYSCGPFGGDKNLWRVNINPKTGRTVGEPQMLSVSATEDIQCALSPDGNELVFSASKLERHLWAYPLDNVTGMISGNPERITFKSDLNYYPELSHDGKKLVWTSHLTSQGVLSFCDLETGMRRKLTREWGQQVREVGGSFSPDGEQICYSSTLGGSYQIWHLPSFGSIALQLTKIQSPYSDALTTWSPDGRILAFYSNRSGNWDIWSIDIGGSGEPKQLTHFESNENYPAWSPDGKKLYFRTDKEGYGDIWIMDADGGNQKPFIEGISEEGWSAWSPDGRWLYFVSNRTGTFNIWAMATSKEEIHRVTEFNGNAGSLSDFVLFTKFAVSSSHLIVPIETRKGNIYKLGNLKE